MTYPSPALESPSSGINWRILGAELAVGLVFFIYNFRGFVAYAANHWAPQWVANPTISLLRFTENSLPFTGSGTALSPFLAEWLVVGLCGYVAILFVTSVVFMKPGRLANGLSGLCVGLGSVVLLSWAVVVLAKIVSVIWTILSFVFGIVGAVLHFIFALVAVILPYLGGIALVVGVVWVLAKLARALGFTLVRYALAAVAAVAAVWLALPLLRWCYASLLLPLLRFLAPIASWIVSALRVVVLVIMAVVVVLVAVGALVFVLGMLGRVAIDQFRTAWAGGKGERPMALAGFSVGSAFALLLTVTAGLPEVAGSIDTAWHAHAWMLNTWSPAASHFQALPDVVANLAATVFQHASAPFFDAVVLALLLPVAAVGTMWWGKALDDAWEWRYLSKDAAIVGGTLGFGLVLLVVAAFSPDDA